MDKKYILLVFCVFGATVLLTFAKLFWVNYYSNSDEKPLEWILRLSIYEILIIVAIGVVAIVLREIIRKK
ncbi:MAG: hypothetical protein HND53_10420 [Proteobacteria bacterium]|nr:hypothetical protein [Pseudomonadota bacterium]NOG60905.1 hypothetical protein [Pseudomonadota bacterium]